MKKRPCAGVRMAIGFSLSEAVSADLAAAQADQSEQVGAEENRRVGQAKFLSMVRAVVQSGSGSGMLP